MFKQLTVSADTVTRQALPIQTGAAAHVFKVLHGFYGNLLLSKFTTGEIDEQGSDKGVKSAMRVWEYVLKDFGDDTVKAALSKCQERHPEFPPSLPQFANLCAALAPRATYPIAALAAPPADAAKRAEQAKKLRELLAKDKQAEESTGLSILKRVIAGAVALAGGDEARELRRLDVMLAPKVAA